MVKAWFPLHWTMYGTPSGVFIYKMFWFLVWLRPVCNQLGVFWNRNGPRCTHSWVGGGRRPQRDPNGMGVREGQPSCPRGGLWGHWQSCRYPGFYPQTHGWCRVSSGIMFLLLGLLYWEGPEIACLKTSEIISNASSNDLAMVFCWLLLLWSESRISSFPASN